MVVAALVSFVAAVGFAEDEADRQDDAQRLVFLLQYVGTDYPAAVREGKVVNEAEFAEMREFSALALERFERLRGSMPGEKAAAVAGALSALAERVGALADEKEIRQLTETVIPTLIESFDLRPLPRHLPATESARVLYRENCAICHGEKGGGDGPRAEELDPRPPAFTDRERLDSTPPYVFYNAITFGIAGTAMASFRESLSDQQRWDLAFFLWSFIAPETAPGIGDDDAAGVELTLRDLAARSSKELAADLVFQAKAAGQELDEQTARAVIADLRARPRIAVDPVGRLTKVRESLRRSIDLIERGDFEAATDQITSSYLHDFEPLEPELDRHDPAIRTAFERGLVELRGAARSGDRKAAAAVARDLVQTADAAAALLVKAQSRRPAQFFVVLGGVALLLVVGIIWIARRPPVEVGNDGSGM